MNISSCLKRNNEVKIVNLKRLSKYLEKETICYSFRTIDNKGNEVIPIVYVYKQKNNYYFQVTFGKDNTKNKKIQYPEMNIEKLADKINFDLKYGQFLCMNKKSRILLN